MNEKYRHLIFKNSLKPMSTIPFHKDIPCIQRFFPEGFPMHLAIHKITAANNSEEYTTLHSHDVHEINIIMSEEDELEYEVKLGDEKYMVQSNFSIWIPAGLKHATNVIHGSGLYIAIRLNQVPIEFENLQYLNIPEVIR